MKLFVSILCFSIFVAMGAALAGEMKEIILTDVDRIRAEVVSFKNGIYTLHSDSLGEIKLRDARIVSIMSPKNENSSTITESSSAGDLQGLTSQLMSNPGIMEKIMSLQNDPEFSSAVKDPEIIKNLSTGNMQNLLNNPKLKKLLEHPTIRDITNSVR